MKTKNLISSTLSMLIYNVWEVSKANPSLGANGSYQLKQLEAGLQ